MARLFYVHWHKDEALETVRRLRAVGHKMDYHWSTGEEAWRLLKDAPPDALVVSLARLPSHGRAVAEVVNQSKRLRELPIIFVGGEPEKVAATRAKFPRAAFCPESELEKLLKKVQPFIAPDPTTKRKAATAPPKSNSNKSRVAAPTAGYSGTPLPQKLGIKTNHRIALINSPPDFRRTLGELPPGVNIVHALNDGQEHNVIVYFTKSRAELAKRFKDLSCRIEPAGGLWISWPKKTSGVATDLTEDVVRAIGLKAGLVDVKVCAVDETWSGLKFVIRVKDRPKR